MPIVHEFAPRDLTADPCSMPIVVASKSHYPKVLHGFQVSSPGPHEVGGGSSFCLSPEAGIKQALSYSGLGAWGGGGESLSSTWLLWFSMVTEIPKVFDSFLCA